MTKSSVASGLGRLMATAGLALAAAAVWGPPAEGADAAALQACAESPHHDCVLAEALAVAQGLQSPGARVRALLEIAQAQMAAGGSQAAGETLETVLSEANGKEQRIWLLLEIARRQVAAATLPAARKTLETVRAEVEEKNH